MKGAVSGADWGFRMGYISYDDKLKTRARSLRKEMTRQERRLWYDFLRGHPVKFLRQKPIGPYIVDFYCHSARLVVELDGGQHYEEDGAAYDRRRDRFLREQGLTVLRLCNLDIDRNFSGICMEIDQRVRPPLRQLH